MMTFAFGVDTRGCVGAGVQSFFDAREFCNIVIFAKRAHNLDNKIRVRARPTSADYVVHKKRPTCAAAEVVP